MTQEASAHRASGFFQGTDVTMLQKLNSIHANNNSFLSPRSIHDTQFGIAHFAGDVYYQAEGEHSSGYDLAGANSGYHRKEEVGERRPKQDCCSASFLCLHSPGPQPGEVLPTEGGSFCFS